MFDKLKNLFSKKELPADRGIPEPKETPKTPKVVKNKKQIGRAHV